METAALFNPFRWNNLAPPGADESAIEHRLRQSFNWYGKPVRSFFAILEYTGFDRGTLR